MFSPPRAAPNNPARGFQAMNLIAQTSQPGIPFPGIDPSWLSWPGVKAVIGVAIVVAAILLAWNKLIVPLVISALQSFGLIGETWRQSMSRKVATVAKAADALTEANKSNPQTPDVPASLEIRVKEIATSDGTATPAPIDQPPRIRT